MRPNVLGKLAVLGVFFAAVTEAQPQPAPPATSPEWSVAAGYESLWFRDVARTGPPVDGSPIAWEGGGPAIVVSHDRGRPYRLHHFEGFFSAGGGFSLETPVRSIPAPSNDGAHRFGARYEYRRYPFRDLWLTGFDIGFGIEGDGERFVFSRHFQPDIEFDRTVTNVGTSGVLAARLHHWTRIDLLAAWGNGLSVGRASLGHRAAIDSEQLEWGGGWQTNLHLRAAVRVGARTSLVASYFNSGEGRLASHDTFTYGRSRFAAGVTYGR